MCNLAELVGGTMTEVSVPATHRWIPKGMTVAYVSKAKTNLRGEAVWDPMPEFGASDDVPVAVKITDTKGELVLDATITMRVSEKRRKD